MTLIRKTFLGENSRHPVWLMRQAGRYLPEYQKTRAQAGSFFGLCDSPNLATEVTLQPIHRFNLDAAIIFSDILVIPRALGAQVNFTEKEGPVLGLTTQKSTISALSTQHILEKTAPTLKALSLVRAALPAEKELIGFCGAPWTIALYMTEPSPAKGATTLSALYYNNPQTFQILMEKIVAASADYLCAQVEAGAGALQIFDSWAAQAADPLFTPCVLTPLLEVCERVKKKHPTIPIILFPRAVGEEKLTQIAALHSLSATQTRFDGLSLCQATSVSWAVETLPKSLLLQGNLDPALMLSTPQVVAREAANLQQKIKQKPNFIINLGHGLTPQAQVENVAALVSNCINV